MGPRQRREPDRRAAVVAEHQERAADGQRAAVERHPRHRRGHRVLADPEVDLATGRVVPGLHAAVLQYGPGVGREVGPAGDQRGDLRHQRLEARATGLAGRHGRTHLPGGEGLLPAGEGPGGQAGVELGPVALVGLEPLRPCLPELAPAAARSPVQLDDVLGDVEGLVRRQAHDRLGRVDVLVLEGVAVGLGVVGLGGGGERDVAAHDHERRLVLDVRRDAQRALEGVGVLGCLAQLLHVPPVGLEPPGGVVAQGELGRTVDRDVVVVVHADEAAEALVAGQRRGLVGQALGQVAVAGDAVRAVVDHVRPEARPQVALRQRHAHRVAEALTEGTGRDLDPRCVTVLGMAGRAAAPLPELLEVAQRQRVPGEVQHRVEEDRRVAGGQDEAVSVRPGRVGRVVPQDARPQDVGERGEGHRGALVPRPRPVRRVHGEAPDHVDGPLLQVHAAHRGHPIGPAPRLRRPATLKR